MKQMKTRKKSETHRKLCRIMDVPKTTIEDNATVGDNSNLVSLNEAYKAYVSPTTVEKELKASYASHFKNRVILSNRAEDALHERFLEILSENPEYINSLLYLGKYKATTHWKVNCPNAPEDCDNCRDDDTDFYMEETTRDVLGDLWKQTFEFMGDEDNSEEDKSEDKDNNGDEEDSVDKKTQRDSLVEKILQPQLQSSIIIEGSSDDDDSDE